MAKDVIITPLDGDIQFKNSSGNDSGKIEQSGDDLVLTNAVGDVLIGDGSSDVFVGDGTNSVDIIFEQPGSIKGLDGSSVNLQIGSYDTDLVISGSTLNLQPAGNTTIIGGPLTVTKVSSDQNTAQDSGTIPATTLAETIKIHGGSYTNGQYTTEIVKVDRSGNLPLYVRQSKGTANAFTNLIRIGDHGQTNGTDIFAVFGKARVDGIFTVTGGSIVLGGTGRIQGIDTVTSGTDAANKNYVDNHTYSHNHDDRYYTETELDAGQLDNRYYTETELDAGQLDNRYYTETEVNEGLSHLRGWVSGYGSGTDSNTRWNFTEDALELQSSADTSIGAVYQARRIENGETVRFTIMVKGSAAASNGLYLRLYQHDGNLPDGKTHVSNDAQGTYVQEDDRGDTSWYENGAITTGWVTFEREYTAPEDGYISLVVLNWTGIGTNSVYLKTPDIQTTQSPNSNKLDGLDSSQFLRSDQGDTMTGNLTISKNNPVLILNETTSTSNADQVAYISFQDNGSEESWIGWGSAGNSNLTINNNIGMVVLNGNGTTQINDNLDLNGNADISGTITSGDIEGAELTSKHSSAPVLNLRRADTSIVNDNSIGSIFFQGDDPSATNTGAAIKGFAAGEWTMSSPNAYPSKLLFQTAKQNTLLTALTINEDQKVGIGTTSPRGKGLEIFRAAGNSSYPQLIISTGESSSKDYGISTDVAGAGDFAIVDGVTNVAANVRLLINSAGNVGIGTTSPSQKLTVKGLIGIQRSSNTATSTLSMEGNFIFNASTGYAHVFAQNGSEKMRITSAGNVGIGTTSPGADLQVVGSGSTVFDVQGSQGQLFSITDDLTGDLFSVSDISGVPILNVNASGDSYFDGNLGIGTSSPTHLLDVNGEARFRNGNLVSNNSFDFLTTGGSAQQGRFKSLQVSTSYSGTIPNNGILFHTDTNLYRGDANLLKTDDSLEVTGRAGIGTSMANGYALTTSGSMTLGVPGAGSVNYARFCSIEGNTDGSGEGSGRIFFTEHNSTTAAMNKYGMSLGYRGGLAAVTTAGGESWGGLSAIGNGTWGMWGHDNSLNGNLIMHGDRAATYVDFASNQIRNASLASTVTGGSGLNSLNASSLDTGTIPSARYSSTVHDVESTLTSGNWNNYIDGTESGWSGVNNHSGTNRPSGAYTYGLQMFWSRASEGKFQMYVPETATLGNATNQGIWFRSGWNTSYRAWAQIVDSTARDQYVGGKFKVTTALGVGGAASSTTGRISATNDVIAFSSDKRLKENIIPIDSALYKISKLSGFTYNWNEKAKEVAGYDTEEKLIGVFAQDVQEVLPEAIKLAPFDNDGNDKSITGDEYLTVQYEKIVPLLIEGIKEQQKQIEELKAIVNKLQNEK